MKMRLMAVIIGISLAACTNAGTDSPKSVKSPSAGGDAGGSKGITEPTDASNEDWNPWGCCELISKRSLSWAEVGSFGVSPEQIFSIFEGSCHAPFRWSQSRQSRCLDQLTISPEVSNGFVEVGVSVEKESAVLVERKDKEGVDCGCGRRFIQIPARITFRTSDGLFQEDRQVTLVHTEGSNNETNVIGWSVAADESSEPIRVQSKVDGAEVHLGVTVFPVQLDCAGYIGVSMVQEKNHIGTAWTCGNQAIWSNKGCEANVLGLQGTKSHLEEPFDGLVEEIAKLWKDTSYEGTWDGSTSTQFHLAVTALAQSACIEYHDVDGSYDFLIPVEVTSYTSDGRIAKMTGTGNVLASVQNDWNISRLNLWMSEKTECESYFDFGYLSLDCSQVDHVIAELSIDHYLDDSANNSGKVELHIFRQASNGMNQENAVKSDLTLSIQLNSLSTQK